MSLRSGKSYKSLDEKRSIFIRCMHERAVFERDFHFHFFVELYKEDCTALHDEIFKPISKVGIVSKEPLSKL